MIGKIEIDPKPEKFFNQLKVSVRDFIRDVMGELYDVMPERVSKVFDGEGVRHGGGEQWEPTSKEGRHNRVSHKFFANTLEDTGYLKESIDSDYFEIPDEHILIVGTDPSNKWAMKHPLGDPKMDLRHSRTGEPGQDLDRLSQREFAFFVPNDEDVVRDIIDKVDIE